MGGKTLLRTTKDNHIDCDISLLKIEDVIDINLLQKFQDNFAKSMNIASVTVDTDGNPVTKPSFYTSFCMNFTQSTDIGTRRCAESHKRGGIEAVRSGKPYVYTCHAGLIDFAVPIIVEDKHIGTILGGQILTSKLEESIYKRTAAEIGVDEFGYLNAVNKIKITNEENIKAAAEVLYIIANALSKMGYEREHLEYLSYHDQLTGLYNRRFFQKELHRLDVQRNLPLTIVMADVNGLKLINDSFGHTMGDELLKKAAEVITKGCRADDIVARFGGDEFVILLPKTDAYGTKEIIRRIKNIALKEKVGSFDIDISFGYGTKNDEEEKIEEIFKKADDNMYKSKIFESLSMKERTIGTIISTLYEKDEKEKQHSHRVSALCQSMGAVLRLSEGEIKELKTVGLFHDIGKIAIEKNILNKQEKLTDNEWEEIKRHPEIGFRILGTVSDMSQIAQYVLAHHEKWDGSGYPKGLKGQEIPLPSRIIAIADSYDAMVSDRNYHNALPEEVAVEELKINAGIQFDPALIRIFIEKVLNKPVG
ncbi:PocR ligand-binding domain-containing protein [Clostridium sp. WILCCON 0269]|uniref:PocR ligand-binding domain-containing protein n=1 Tax=Candidatus Clostridium eludens TaxID=3381663 RepID=A0ABW8SI65_9CLOT